MKDDVPQNILKFPVYIIYYTIITWLQELKMWDKLWSTHLTPIYDVICKTIYKFQQFVKSFAKFHVIFKMYCDVNSSINLHKYCKGWINRCVQEMLIAKWFRCPGSWVIRKIYIWWYAFFCILANFPYQKGWINTISYYLLKLSPSPQTLSMWNAKLVRV